MTQVQTSLGSVDLLCRQSMSRRNTITMAENSEDWWKAGRRRKWEGNEGGSRDVCFDAQPRRCRLSGSQAPGRESRARPNDGRIYAGYFTGAAAVLSQTVLTPTRSSSRCMYSNCTLHCIKHADSHEERNTCDRPNGEARVPSYLQRLATRLVRGYAAHSS